MEAASGEAAAAADSLSAATERLASAPTDWDARSAAAALRQARNAFLQAQPAIFYANAESTEELRLLPDFLAEASFPESHFSSVENALTAFSDYQSDVTTPRVPELIKPTFLLA